MQKIYDLVIIWAWAAGIFTAIHTPKDMKKCILEKTKKLGTKVLMSGGERCNVSNIDIEAERDYFGKNTKALHSLLKRFSNYDMIDWLESRGVKTHIEDRGRIILHSGRATELVDILSRELEKNNTDIYYNSPAENIILRDDGFFEVHTSPHSNLLHTTRPHPNPLPRGEGTSKKYLQPHFSPWEKIVWGQSWEELWWGVQSGEELWWEIFLSKKVVISSWGKSFASVGTDGWGYRIAEKFWHTLNEPFKWLCGMVTKEDLSELKGSTVFLDISLYDGDTLVYTESDGSFLFTHFWVTGPMIYNAVVKLGSYLRAKWISSEKEAWYIKDNITLKLRFLEHSLTKKLEKYFTLSPENMEVTLHINDLRGWSEAKVTGWGVFIDELDKNFQSKLIPNLYFIGEVIDITWKTWGFNLQSAWSQGYVVGKSL